MKESNLGYVQPDIYWYTSISRGRGLTHRCAFASAGLCPRYYLSLLIMGMAGVSAPIPPDEYKKLKNKWENSDIHLVVAEQKPCICINIFSNFCPEITNDRFGWFASLLKPYAREAEKKLAHTRLKKRKVPKNDWRWSWAKVVPQHYSDCPVYSPLIHHNGINVFPQNNRQTRRENEGRLNLFTHSPDFRSVSLQGHNFALTHKQSHVIEILYEAHNSGNPEVGNAYILEELGTPSSRLRDTFRTSKDAWRSLVARGRKKGTLRLNI